MPLTAAGARGGVAPVLPLDVRHHPQRAHRLLAESMQPEQAAQLIERHSDSGEATVQLSDDLSMRTLMMDEVAEYRGN